jgi:hypothetical protein
MSPVGTIIRGTEGWNASPLQLLTADPKISFLGAAAVCKESTEKAPARKALNIVVFTIICFKKTEALLQSH